MKSCFVIMPFRPELRFLYERLRQHVEERFPEVRVTRGDDRILTRPILEKIAEDIRNADVVLADCSGRNPNVFYELGLAHGLNRPVILLTSDPVEQTPADIRAFELISYALNEPEAFLHRLDTALSSVLGSPFAGLYESALGLFVEFRQATGLGLEAVNEDTFVRMALSLGTRPPAQEGYKRAEFLIRRLLGVLEPDIELLARLKEWLDQRFPRSH